MTEAAVARTVAFVAAVVVAVAVAAAARCFAEGVATFLKETHFPWDAVPMLATNVHTLNGRAAASEVHGCHAALCVRISQHPSANGHRTVSCTGSARITV